MSPMGTGTKEYANRGQRRPQSPEFKPPTGRVTPDLFRTKEGSRSPLPRTRTPEKRTKSPTADYVKTNDRVKSPTGRKTPEKRVPSPTERAKSPHPGRISPGFESILSSLRNEETSGHQSSLQPSQRKENRKNAESAKNQAFVDFLLDDPAPKPVPRKRGSRSTSQDSQSVHEAPSRSLSPGSTKERLSRDQATEKKQTLSWDRGGRKSPLARPLTPSRTQDPKSFHSLPPFPSLAPSSSGSLMKKDVFPREREEEVESSSLSKKEQEKVEEGADELLALFDKVMKEEDPAEMQAHIEKKKQEMIKSKIEEQKSADHKARMRRPLSAKAAGKKAKEENKDPSKDSPREEKPQRPKKKSYRTPPVNYNGLGSLTMLKELKKKDVSSPRSDDSCGTISADDIRKTVYLEWLAKREEEGRKKRKEEEKKKLQKEEEERKEREDKELENNVVRKKWEEIKKEKEIEKRRIQIIQERHKEKEKQEKELQRKKSEKQADKRREQLKEEAKIKHREEMERKREEELKKKQRERRQKEMNKTAVNSWKQKRGQEWLEQRRKEEKEKRTKKRNERIEKEEAAKEAEEKYKTWREEKDLQLKVTLREKKMMERRKKYGIAENDENILPPWSPPNKVIPKNR